MTWESWTSGARPRKNILFELEREAKQMEGDPREILICPAADPYQSDEAARLTRKALLILEQYHLRVQVVTLGGMRSVAGFRHFGAQSLEIRHDDSLSVGKPARGVGARRRANRRADPGTPRSPCGGNLYLGQNPPVAYPAELIDVVESLRADVDAWKIGRPPPGEPPPKAIVGRATRLRRRRHCSGLSSPYGRERLKRQAASYGRDEDMVARPKGQGEKWRPPNDE